ncbi:MAG TPA: SH3 domain-containing protein, partial [Aggregatilineales bacterium]|nr:SH3 domain-containing protein [Aggregatilineales bacterium]
SWQPDPSITFETVEIPSPTPSATDTPSAPQSVVESVLVEGQQSSWYFDGDADLAVTIIVQSDAFDTIAQLYTLDGGLLIENDDFDGTNSQIDFTLPDEAVYQVVITSFYGDASGDYTLSVVGIEGDLREKPQGGRFIATPTATATYTPTATATATLRPTSTHTPTATFTPTITPSPTFGFDRAQCPANLPPRLAIDTRGRVLPGGTSAVYEQPLTDSTQLGEIPGGVSFTVLDGPVCTDGFIWWQVEYRDITGWTIEAGAGEYFLEPLRR